MVLLFKRIWEKFEIPENDWVLSRYSAHDQAERSPDSRAAAALLEDENGEAAPPVSGERVLSTATHDGPDPAPTMDTSVTREPEPKSRAS